MSVFTKKHATCLHWVDGNKTLKDVAAKANIAPATAEAYITDMIVDGSGCARVQQRLLEEMGITARAFKAVEEQLGKRGASLGEIKDATGLSYNQICAVIAVRIRGFEM